MNFTVTLAPFGTLHISTFGVIVCVLIAWFMLRRRRR